MRVIVYAQDLSSRRDDGHYSKESIDDALDVFYGPEDQNYLDRDCDDPLHRADAKGIFDIDGKVTFFNAAGEKIVIAADPSG